jgi:type VI secretion system secreted protein VgrG
LQSQFDDTLLDSAKSIQVRAVEHVVLTGKSLSFIAEDGSFIKVGEGGIQLGSNGPIAQHAPSFPLSGSLTMSSVLPQFEKSGTDQKFKLRFGEGQGAQAQAPQVAANTAYRIVMSDQSVVQGVTDAQGNTQVLQKDAMHMASVEHLDQPKD